MYRSTKKRLVRRLGAASVLAGVAVVGLGITVFSQGAVVNSTNKPTTNAVATSTSSSAKYHLVSENRESSKVDE